MPNKTIRLWTNSQVLKESSEDNRNSSLLSTGKDPLHFVKTFLGGKSFYKGNSLWPLFLIFRLSEALKEGKNKKNKSNVNVRDQVQP